MQNNDFINFTKFLKVRLNSALPARNAHAKMAPTLNDKSFRDFEPGGQPLQSGVLIIIYNDDSEPAIVLTLRSNKLKNHSGQISLPGGRMDKGETIVETALREAEEEIALETEHIEILGNLSDLYVPPSNNLITPVVGLLKKEQEYIKNEDEVEEIFFVKLSDLESNEFFRKEPWKLMGKDVLVPHWTIHETTPLWGATAMILSELLELYREFKIKK